MIQLQQHYGGQCVVARLGKLVMFFYNCRRAAQCFDCSLLHQPQLLHLTSAELTAVATSIFGLKHAQVSLPLAFKNMSPRHHSTIRLHKYVCICRVVAAHQVCILSCNNHVATSCAELRLVVSALSAFAWSTDCVVTCIHDILLHAICSCITCIDATCLYRLYMH